MRITKRQLKSVIREVIEESYKYPTGRTMYSDYLNADGYLETQYDAKNNKIGRDVYLPTKEQEDYVKHNTIGKLPKGKLAVIKSNIDDGTYTFIFINPEKETVSFPVQYEFNDDRYGELKWERPYKYAKFLTNNPEYFDIMFI